VRTREDQPDKEPDPHYQWTERDSERTERVRLGRVRTREDPTRPRGEPDPSKSLSDFISKDGHGIAQYL